MAPDVERVDDDGSEPAYTPPGMETVADALRRLERSGYAPASCTDDGRLRIAGESFAPRELVIEEVVRFEGESDPADEQILFAVHHAARHARGAWLCTYGRNMSEQEQRIAQALEWEHHA